MICLLLVHIIVNEGSSEHVEQGQNLKLNCSAIIPTCFNMTWKIPEQLINQVSCLVVIYFDSNTTFLNCCIYFFFFVRPTE